MKPLLLSTFVCLSACGVATATAEESDDSFSDSESELSLSCVLGVTCPAVLPVLPEVAPKDGPSASASHRTYWAPDAPSGLNVPRTALTQTLTGLRLERDDLAVWVSSTADGTGPVVADELLLLEVRNSAGSVLARRVLTGPRLLLADHTTEVPGTPSSWDGARQGFSAPATDIAALLPRGRVFSLKLTVLNVQGLTANAPVRLVVAPRAAPPPPVVRRIDDLFDAEVRRAQPQATIAELAARFAPGAGTARMNAVLAGRSRDCRDVTGCSAWGGWVRREPGVISLTSYNFPFAFDVGRRDDLLVSLSGSFGSMWRGPRQFCVGAELCHYFPPAERSVSPDALWAVSTIVTVHWNGGCTESQYAVYARFSPTEVPAGRFEQTAQVSW